MRQGSTLLDCFIPHKGFKVEQISPLFHLYLYLFFKFRRTSILSMPTTKYCTDIYTEYRSRRMAKKEKSTFRISSLLLSSFISNIYTPEKGYYWQNQPNSRKVRGIKKSTPMSSNYCTEKKFCPPQSSRSHRNQRL